MATATQTDTKAPQPLRVRSRPDVARALEHLAELQNEQDDLEQKRDHRLAKIAEVYNKPIADLEATIAEQVKNITEFVRENRELVFEGATKAITEAGELAVKKLPVKVVCEDEKQAVRSLEALDPDSPYLRRTVALDKRSLAKDRFPIEGIAYVEGEQLVILPTSGERITAEL